MQGGKIKIFLNGCNSDIQNSFECDLIKEEQDAFSD
jgi:hypothetical protein